MCLKTPSFVLTSHPPIMFLLITIYFVIVLYDAHFIKPYLIQCICKKDFGKVYETNCTPPPVCPLSE